MTVDWTDTDTWRPVTVNKVEIVRRMRLALPAVAADRRRDSHMEHTRENRGLIPVFHTAGRIDSILMHVNVDKTRADDQAGGIDNAVRP